jgi:hypothetical protein
VGLHAITFGQAKVRVSAGKPDAVTAHLNGQIAAALMAKADELLSDPPDIRPIDVQAAKLPG